MEIRPYSPALANDWNRLVAESPNATFLFDRNYMDYHSDRFTDASLTAYDDKGRLLAILPANRTDTTLHSHQGLTYGGWALSPKTDPATLIRIWEKWLQYCRDSGVNEIYYKPLPHFYHSRPSQTDEYLLFRSGASIAEASLSSTIDLRSPKGFSKTKRWELSRGSQYGLRVEETIDTEAFSNLLSDCLKDRHNAIPVHSSAELELLRSRFPDRIRLFCIRIEGTMQAGACIFDTGTVAHVQYICSTPVGRKMHMLPVMFHTLISETYASLRWFDFGTSCENHGLKLNEGLLHQKTAFGACPTIYSRYKIDLTGSNIINII